MQKNDPVYLYAVRNGFIKGANTGSQTHNASGAIVQKKGLGAIPQTHNTTGNIVPAQLALPNPQPTTPPATPEASGPKPVSWMPDAFEAPGFGSWFKGLFSGEARKKMFSDVAGQFQSHFEQNVLPAYGQNAIQGVTNHMQSLSAMDKLQLVLSILFGGSKLGELFNANKFMNKFTTGLSSSIASNINGPPQQ